MNKKAIYLTLSVVVAIMVLSVSLVFAIGPRVSADSESETEWLVGILQGKEMFEYYSEYNQYTGTTEIDYQTIVGLSPEGDEYTRQFDEIHVIIPEGITCVKGLVRGYYHYVDPYGIFTCSNDSSGVVYPTPASKVTSVILPNSLEIIGDFAFEGCGINSITIPAKVNTIAEPYKWGGIEYDIFHNCTNLNTIIVENSDLLENENLQMWKDILRYEAPKCTVTFDTVGGNTIDNQVVTKNGTVTEPTAPTKDGYEFKGWLLNGEPYDFATPVTADMTLTAKWEAVQTQPEQPEPETPVEENDEINNQNNAGLIWGIAGTSAGVLIIAGIVIGIVISKRRRK